MMTPRTETELADAIKEAKGPLRITGGGTRDIGNPVVGEALSTAGLSGITLYEPGALTIVARAGTPVAEITAALDGENQRLAFEPMDHRILLGSSGTPTIGGIVAANVSGPRRISVGACRDHLLGVRFVDGAGTIIKNGGRVMKNVTGYDLVKLLAGSYGTLGVLSEVSLKVLPKQDSATVCVRGVAGLRAVEAMTRAIVSPFEVSGAATVTGEGAYLRIEGMAASVAYRTGRLRELLKDLGEIVVIDDAETSAKLWKRLRDVEDFATGSAAVWRISTKPSDMVPGLLTAVCQFVEVDVQLDWAGGLAWVRLTQDGAQNAAVTLEAGEQGVDAGIVALHRSLQTLIGDIGGHATLVKAPVSARTSVSVFQPENPTVTALTRGLRDKFDPRGILNTGLMG